MSAQHTYVTPASPEVLESCTDTMTNQGLVAVVEIPQFGSSWRDEAEKSNKCPLYLIVDAVSDPGNLGTLIRSARAVGCTACILLQGSCDPWNPKAIRSAMGTTFSIPIYEMVSWIDCAQQLREAGCTAVYAAAVLEGNAHGSVRYDCVDWTKPSALVIGSEGNGLTTLIRESLLKGHVDQLPMKAIHVPMQEGVESLNAAVCGSIILFEYFRQIQPSP